MRPPAAGKFFGKLYHAAFDLRLLELLNALPVHGLNADTIALNRRHAPEKQRLPDGFCRRARPAAGRGRDDDRPLTEHTRPRAVRRPAGEGQVEQRFHLRRGDHAIGWGCENEQASLLERVGDDALLFVIRAGGVVFDATVAPRAEMVERLRQEEFRDLLFPFDLIRQQSSGVIGTALMGLSVYEYDLHDSLLHIK